MLLSISLMVSFPGVVESPAASVSPNERKEIELIALQECVPCPDAHHSRLPKERTRHFDFKVMLHVGLEPFGPHDGHTARAPLGVKGHSGLVSIEDHAPPMGLIAPVPVVGTHLLPALLSCAACRQVSTPQALTAVERSDT